MAFGVGPHDSDDEQSMADINVTPLVDVMLVLLIIFMITAPMLHQGIEVALPRAEADAMPQRAQDPLVISVNRDGLVFLQDQPIHQSQLVERLTSLLGARGEETVFLKGDREVAYGRIVEVLDLLHQGGIVNVGMVTEKPRRTP
ncbi:MAG: protein TolR [Thermoanaerobaculia bacterium]|nr:protein TolR [Thermoanaerobaculia bacterium]